MLKTLKLWCGGAAFLAVSLVASPQHVPAADGGPTVFAGASLKNALDAVASDWQAKTGKKPVISYAATSSSTGVFLTYLRGPDAASRFEAHGFSVVSPATP